MKNSHSLRRNPEGIQQGNRLMNRTDHSRPKWASLHIKFLQSIIRRGQGRFPPAQGTRAGAWNSGTCDAGGTGSGAFTGGSTDG